MTRDRSRWETATYPISNPFPTIDAAVAEATRIGALEPLQVTFPWKPSGYRIRDDEHNVVRVATYYGRRTQVRERGRAGGSHGRCYEGSVRSC